MRVEVAGKQLDVGDALRRHIEERLSAAVEKHAHRPVDAQVRLSKEGRLFRCDCAAHLSTGLAATASGEDPEPYTACDRAIERLEKQLRRYKRRLTDHHQRRKEPIAQLEAMAYVLSETKSDVAGDTPEEEVPHEPLIIAEDRTAVPTLTVGEAVMQMELKGDSFLLFVNDGEKRLNVVYRRKDGNIGWVDPALGSST